MTGVAKTSYQWIETGTVFCCTENQVYLGNKGLEEKAARSFSRRIGDIIEARFSRYFVDEDFRS